MTISAILMILNVALLWWLFMTASRTVAKIFLIILALANTWVALERFHVLPTHLGNRTVIRSDNILQNAGQGRWGRII